MSGYADSISKAAEFDTAKDMVNEKLREHGHTDSELERFDLSTKISMLCAIERAAGRSLASKQ